MTNQLPSDWGQPTWGAKPVTEGRSAPPTGTAVGPGSDAPAPPPPPVPVRPPPSSVRRRQGRGQLAGVIGAFLLIGAILVGGFVLLVMWVVGMAQGPIEATNSFVADLDEGRLADAYSSLCAETQLSFTLDEFTEQMSAAEAITGYTFVSASVRSGDETIVSGTIDLDDVPMAVDFGLQEESGGWKICSYDTIG